MNVLRFCGIILIWSLISSLQACSDSEEEELTTLNVSKETISFSNEGGETVLYVQAGGGATLTGDAAWCEVNELTSTSTKTQKFSVKVAKNETTTQRMVTLIAEKGSVQRTIQVVQKAGVNLVLTKNRYEVAADGETIWIELQASEEYKMQVTGGEWIHILSDETLGRQAEKIQIDANYQPEERTGTIYFSIGTVSETVTIVQAACDIPSADKNGVESDACALARKITLGWNLGNVMECTPGGEASWGNPKASKQLIDVVKAAGFNAVRIPCAWDQYIENTETYQIKASWLARVKEVIDDCLDNEMYVILNIHWDNGWLENHPTYDKQAEVNRKQAALWRQIATYFRAYDEHLLFAGTNEVHADYNAPTAEHLEVQHSFNQTFVDAVRATGGKNVYRNLIVQAYNTNARYAIEHLKMPVDATPGRLMMEMHYYDPWDFAGEDKVKYWGKPYLKWGVSTWGQEEEVDAIFAALKASFVDKGYPIVMGEYGANRHSSTDETMIASRAGYLRYVTAAAKKNGIVPFYWDNGGMGNGADEFGLFDRKTCTVFDQAAIDALMQGATTQYPY